MLHFFLSRPRFASIVSIVIVLIGTICALQLPISQYPKIAPPIVTITATYLGANSETLSKTVAAPIEEQLSGVDHLLYFNSNADSSGVLTITATFEIGTNIDQATFNINNRVGIALPRLPEEVRRNGISVQKKSNDISLVIMLTSGDPKHDRLFLSNYATLNLLDEIRRTQGVGDAFIFGGQDYAMRIWLQPDRMAHFGITPADIMSAINAQNNQYAIGKIGAEPAVDGQQLTYTISSKGRLLSSDEFSNILLRAKGAEGVLRLKDVARIELGAQSYNVKSYLDGTPGAAIPIFLQTNANALETTKNIKQKMMQLQRKFPDKMRWSVPYDTSDFVKTAMREVLKTLVEALVLVALVVFLFLQSWRATLIPMIAVPISLIGTFAGLYVLGFSINLLTLFAMILAIGIVVDDAIVVLENTERIIKEEGLSSFEAAKKSITQVKNAVIAVVLVLVAVFVPVAFQGGVAGELYRQFAVTLTLSIVISGIVALTLTPTLCAKILRSTTTTAAHQASSARIYAKRGVIASFLANFNHQFQELTEKITHFVANTLKHPVRVAGVLGIVMILCFLLFRIVPSGFVPAEDQGYVISAVIMPDGATLGRTEKTTSLVQKAIIKDPATAHTFAVNGFELLTGSNKPGASTMFVRLKDWSERKASAYDIIGKLFGIGMQQSDGMAIAFNPPAISGLGSAGGFEVYVQSTSDASPQQLFGVTQAFISALKKHPYFADVNSFFRPISGQISLEVDDAKALTMGVKIPEIYMALQSMMGSLYVNDFTRSGRTYRVLLQADAPFRMRPEDLSKIYVRGIPSSEYPMGSMIPLSALIHVKNTIGADQLERFNGLLSAKLFGSGAPGISSGEIIRQVEKIAEETLPRNYTIAWTGQAFQEKKTGSAGTVAFAFAIVMVFLILSAQFETWKLPLAVIMGVPFAVLGALFAIFIRGMPNDIYFQIGLIVLIGLSAKNAILIVEFASQKIAEGMDPLTAAVASARLRFRPIIMTSMAFILGIFPLIIATGAGAAARQSMGTGVLGGMLLTTFLATLFIPAFFTWLSHGYKGHKP